MSADDTAKNSKVGKPFMKGKSGNPAGRPKGARNKLSEVFLETLANDFRENGQHTIEKLRNSDPKAYLQIIAAVTAKIPVAEVNLNNNTLVSNNRVMIVTDHGTDAEWEMKLRQQQRALTEDVSGTING